MSRVTSKDLVKRVEHLTNVSGIKYEVNIWHKHFSVHESLDKGALGLQIACSDTARGCLAQVQAVINYQHLLTAKELRKDI